ncbi:hypothetical protein [Nocardia sp. NPDC004711]
MRGGPGPRGGVTIGDRLDGVMYVGVGENGSGRICDGGTCIPAQAALAT